MLEKSGADFRGYQQESREFLGEHIVSRNGIPGFPRHLHFRMWCWRNSAEITCRHELDLVVIVEDDAAESCHAEILPQHVAGEDVGNSQFPNCVTVFPNGTVNAIVPPFLLGLGKVYVKGFHPALNVNMLDH